MDLKMKDIIILATVIFLSFPVVFVGVLFFSGNLRVEVGPKKRAPEEERKIELIKQSVRTDSLAFSNSKIYQAIQQERIEMAQERQKLSEERQRLEVFQKDLEAQKAEVTKERERIEGLVSKSDTLGRKKTVQLAKVYSAMRPAEAAQIIGTLDDEMAARILDGIGDDRQKAKILAALPGEKSTRITQLMGGTPLKR